MIHSIVQKQRDYFHTGATLPLAFRKAQLKKLHQATQSHCEEITEALRQDLGKSPCEGFMCEVGMVLSEISYMLRNMKKFSKKRAVPTPLAQFAAKSYTMKMPYGNVLIMSPWNYPFLLTMEPLVDAIAAGNTAVVKPSAYAPATAKVVKDILQECFAEEYVAVVTGGRQENARLLEEKFDLVFFTGSQNVGKEVLRRCAEHLTPAVLELGGKSPCIVDETANIPLAAKRIVFGKFLNCGQTCVAPDHILCHTSVKEQLVRELHKQISEQFGEKPLENPNYGKIINRKHFDRLCALGENPVCNGDTLQIAPTILENATWDSPAMAEEIFGPILPVLTYENLEALTDKLRLQSKPLALYIFSEDRRNIRTVTETLSFGGGCINDVVIHLATSDMGFGGVGESGMGAYHGKTGFDAFSHEKSMVDKKTWMDLPIRYQPYTSGKENLIRSFLK